MTITRVRQFAPVKRSKINEIISAIGSITLSWANVDGFGVSIRRSEGIISNVVYLTDGIYKLTFDPILPSAFYAAFASCTITDGNDTGFVQVIQQSKGFITVQCRNDDGHSGPVSILNVVIVGPDPNNIVSSLSKVNLQTASYQDTEQLIFSLDSAGTATIIKTGDSSSTSYQFIEDPLDLNLYQVRATFLSGNVPTGTFDSWLSMPAELSWTLNPITIEEPPGSGLMPYFYTSCSIRLEIRDIASYSVRASAVVTLSLAPPPENGGGGGDSGNGDGSGGEGAGNGGSL